MPMKKLMLQVFTTVAVLWAIFSVSTGNPETSQPTISTASVQSSATQGIPLPILMYHSLLKDGARAGAYVLSPSVFQRDLQYLQRNGYQTVTVSDLLAYVQNGTPLPPKPVMITFDDGYYNNYVYAYPLLQRMQMRAVISVIGKETASYSANGQENTYWSYLNTSRLQEMVRSGVFEVENHSYNLHTFGERRGCIRERGEDKNKYASLLRSDTLRAQEVLTEAGLEAPACYTYPFGSFSSESETLLRDMGFRCTMICASGMNYITRDPDCLYRLKRSNRPSGIATQAFMHKIGV